jgi:hypothetical protein
MPVDYYRTQILFDTCSKSSYKPCKKVVGKGHFPGGGSSKKAKQTTAVERALGLGKPYPYATSDDSN